jgi:hypothetical protein
MHGVRRSGPGNFPLASTIFYYRGIAAFVYSYFVNARAEN